jgi:Methane oxygenase PmoA
MKIKITFLLFLVLSCQLLRSQEIARFKISEKGADFVPACVSLDGFNFNTDYSGIVLFEITPAGEKKVPCQLETGPTTQLWFIDERSGIEKKYIIRKMPGTDSSGENLSVVTNEQATVISKNGAQVLSYNHAEVYPPEGVDAKYKRSGFIHPLYSPGGEVLTRIQAPDHYHHYGIWNPWTKTTIDGREVDFWNLVKGGYLDAVQGPVFAGFKVHQEHVFFVEKGREKLAMNEVWDVRVWDIPLRKVSVVDLTTTLNTPLPSGIMLDAYRYGGGIGYRATEKWNKDNCTVLTSEGKNRAEADGTNARWCIVEGESGVPEGRSGILFLSHPSNRMHPEPMRVWPLDANNGRGDMYFEFCPIRHESWKLETLKNYTLKYRMIVFDGKMSAEEADKYWKSFSVTPQTVLIDK